MIGLVETGWQGAAFAISDIASIGPVTKDKEGNRWQKVHLRGGAERRVTDNEVGMLLRRPVQVLPAKDGTELCHWWRHGETTELSFTPVIAWGLCLNGELRPMTTAGIDDGMSEQDGGNYVRLPNGTIHGIGAYTDVAFFDNEEAFLRYLNRREVDRTPAAQDGETAA